MNVKTVDTKEYIFALKSLVEEGKEVRLTITGGSMSPFLVHGRDTICFSKPKRQLKKGDMVFYQRENGQYVMHRICRVKKDGYYIVGDAQWRIEGPVPKDAIFALVTSVRRKGRWIDQKNFWWWFFAHIWIRVIPFRRVIRKAYSGIRRIL